jgi:hypothetical protein
VCSTSASHVSCGSGLTVQWAGGWQERIVSGRWPSRWAGQGTLLSVATRSRATMAPMGLAVLAAALSVSPALSLTAGRWDGRPALLSPGRHGCLIQCARRLLRRDVDGAIRLPRAGGRRPEGERDGSRSGRPAATVSGGAAAMSPSRRPPRGTWPTVTDGVRPSQVHACGAAAACSGAQNRRARVPKGNPLRRAHGPHGPSLGCGVGTRAPVAPPPMPPAGLGVLLRGEEDTGSLPRPKETGGSPARSGARHMQIAPSSRAAAPRPRAPASAARSRRS